MTIETERAKPRRRILVAEDEANLCNLLKRSLGQCHDVEAVGDGAAAVEAFEAGAFDLVILDIMMPKLDGFEVCEHIRLQSDVPIIMLTALGGVDDIVKGFNLGADDYITKPFTFRELIARVEAVFRRADWVRVPVPPRVIVNGELRIYVDTRQVICSGHEVHLTPVEFQLLHFLASQPGQVISKDVLFREVWGYDLAGGTNLVEVGVRRLREKIECDPSRPLMIQTARGAGYRFRKPPLSGGNGAPAAGNKE